MLSEDEAVAIVLIAAVLVMMARSLLHEWQRRR